jgi:capsular polysaccharide transport system ATP-binding protein
MAGRPNFALSLAVEFDCYLVDQIMAAGDQSFQRRSHEELFEKRVDRSLIMASHIPDLVKSYCSRALVLYRGRGKVFDDLDLALDIYQAL